MSSNANEQNSSLGDTTKLNIRVLPDASIPPAQLFPILHPSNASTPPTLALPTSTSSTNNSRPDFVTQSLPRAPQPPAYELRPTNVKPGPTRMTLWFLPSGAQSANTGQLTCHAWARSINIARAMERFGPFHAAVAPIPFIEDLGVKQLLNNTAHVFLGPLASKWDIPIWSVGPPDDTRKTLSGLYQTAKNLRGPTSVVIVWDPQWLIPMQHTWLEGLVQSGDMDAVQASGWKQRIGPLRSSEPDRVDRMEFEISQGRIRNFQWRSIVLKPGNQLHGCPS